MKTVTWKHIYYHMHIYYHTPIDNQWEFAFMAQGIQMRPCNNLEGWEELGVEREIQDRGDICIPMFDSC